jgi:hypothetical protein
MGSPFNLDSFMAEINDRFDLDNDQNQAAANENQNAELADLANNQEGALEQNTVTDTDTIAGDAGDIELDGKQVVNFGNADGGDGFGFGGITGDGGDADASGGDGGFGGSNEVDVDVDAEADQNFDSDQDVDQNSDQEGENDLDADSDTDIDNESEIEDESDDVQELVI